MPVIPAPKPNHQAVLPFRSGEEAWFWTSRALATRRQRRRPAQDPVRRPCTPDEVLRCLDQLYRVGRIDLVHARVLRDWGARGSAPGRQRGERSDYQQWREAIGCLEELLRARGFVTGCGIVIPTSEAEMSRPKNSLARISLLTKLSTQGRDFDEANRAGSLIAIRTAGVSRLGTIRLLPLAAISPPNPDQLRVTSYGVTLSFLVPILPPSTFINKEI